MQQSNPLLPLARDNNVEGVKAMIKAGCPVDMPNPASPGTLVMLPAPGGLPCRLMSGDVRNAVPRLSPTHPTQPPCNADGPDGAAHCRPVGVCGGNAGAHRGRRNG